VRFFVGMHRPADAGKVSFPAFISVNTIRNRKSGFPVGDWIMDSGAFSTILRHGGYPYPPEEYAAQIRRWSTNGNLLAAISQDFMCEPVMVERTGLTIAEHQRLTIERYDAILKAGTGGVYLMPVLQGYAPADYVEHLRQYGERIRHNAWVGVGSVCKRNSSPAAIENVLLTIMCERPDLRLHGFGIKTTALKSGIVWELLYSADSMAWSFAARRNGRDANSWREAQAFAERITPPVQGALL